MRRMFSASEASSEPRNRDGLHQNNFTTDTVQTTFLLRCSNL